MATRELHIAVAGAGLVGLSCALYLQSRGFTVSLIDGNAPGAGATSGNACTIADYSCIPVNHPTILTRLPKFLWGQDSPVNINLGYALTHLPWMLKFLRHCTPSAVTRSSTALAAILRHTHSGMAPLIKMTGADDLVVQNGMLYAYESEPEMSADWPNHAQRIEHGATIEKLNRGQIQDLEPKLAPIFQCAAFFPTVRRIVNPQRLATRYFEHFINHGGHYINSHATGIIHNPTGMKVFLANRQFLRANRFIVCAGAFSGRIEGCDAEKLPLDTERGYHVEYAGRQHMLTRPVAWASGGFYAVPTDEALRCAGTVEIAGLKKAANQRRIAYLSQKAGRMFNIADPPSSSWLGYRPTMPDALPVIGTARRSPNTFYAFGHQHLGITLAGITGKVIAELVSGERPSIDLTPFSPDRFMRAARGPVEVSPAQSRAG